MIETAHNPRIAQAFADAHAERGRAFAKAWKWITGKKDVPLHHLGLTEQSRCA